MKQSYLSVYYSSLTAIGGVVNVVRSLLDEAGRHGQFHPIYHYEDWSRETQSFAHDATTGFDTWHYPLRTIVDKDKRVSVKSLAAFLVHFIPAVLAIHRQIVQAKVAIVHLHAPMYEAVHYAVVRRLYGGFKLIYTLHRAEVWEMINAPKWRRNIWEWILRQCDSGSAVSEDKQQLVMKVLPSLPPPVFIPNGVCIAELQREVRSGPIPPRPAAFVVTALGGFREVKGYDVLLKAFARFRQTCTDCHLELLGASGEWSEYIPQLAERLGVREYVTIREDVPHAEAIRYLSRCDLFVIASRDEGLPVALLEAGALRRVVVSSDVGGIRRVVRHEENGYIVPPEDADELAQALNTAIADEHAAHMAERLSLDVAEGFGLSRAWGSYLSLVEHETETVQPALTLQVK